MLYEVITMLKPALGRGELQCIGATTMDEYRKYIEKDGALERRFQTIIVNPPAKDQTLDILGKILRIDFRTILGQVLGSGPMVGPCAHGPELAGDSVQCLDHLFSSESYNFV